MAPMRPHDSPNEASNETCRTSHLSDRLKSNEEGHSGGESQILPSFSTLVASMDFFHEPQDFPHMSFSHLPQAFCSQVSHPIPNLLELHSQFFPPQVIYEWNPQTRIISTHFPATSRGVDTGDESALDIEIAEASARLVQLSNAQ